MPIGTIIAQVVAMLAWNKIVDKLMENAADKFADKLTESAIEKAKEKWQKFNWEESTQKYLERLYKLHGTVRILGQSKSVPLEGIFTDVFVLDKISAHRRFDIARLQKDPSQLKAERKNGLGMVKNANNQRLFILGKPGAGKTTFLKYLTMQAVQGNLHKTPMFVSLHEWANSGLELMPFLVKQFEICAFPDAQLFIEQILENGDAIVLFDGLDEVKQENNKRSQFIDVLKNFSNQYFDTQIVITCRIAATEYTFEQFTYAEVADFTEEQMQVYAEKWFRNNPTKKQAFFEEWKKDEHKGLRDLGKIPLLLSLLCLTFDETMNFPQRRVEIYEESLDALLKKWDSSRNIQRDSVYHALSLGRKKQLFARIAAETFKKNAYFFKQSDLSQRIQAFFDKLPPADKRGEEEEIDGDKVLKAIEVQHGIFVERAYQIYSFSHLTFQEYFTAKYTVDNATHDFLNLINNRLQDSRWHEVLLLTVSLLDDADEFFEIFGQAVDNTIKNEELLIEYIKWINEKSNAVNTPHKSAAVKSAYALLSLSLSRTLSRALSRARNLSRARDLALALDLDLSLALSLDRALSRARDLALSLDLDFNFDLDLALDLAINLPFDLRIDSALIFAQQFGLIFSKNDEFLEDKQKFNSYFKEIIHVCQQGNLPKLHHALTNLTVPNENSEKKEWAVFTEDLRKIMQIHRNIGHEWNFVEEQIEKLRIYFEANRLLIECLRLAVVSNRKGIENNLLIPPE